MYTYDRVNKNETSVTNGCSMRVCVCACVRACVHSAEVTIIMYTLVVPTKFARISGNDLTAIRWDYRDRNNLIGTVLLYLYGIF